MPHGTSLRIAAVTALVIGLLLPVSCVTARAQGQDPPECIGYLGSETSASPGPGGGIGVGVGKGGGHKGGGVGGGSGQQYDYEFVLTCPTNGPDGPNDPCPPATQSCGNPNLYH